MKQHLYGSELKNFDLELTLFLFSSHHRCSLIWNMLSQVCLHRWTETLHNFNSKLVWEVSYQSINQSWSQSSCTLPLLMVPNDQWEERTEIYVNNVFNSPEHWLQHQPRSAHLRESGCQVTNLTLQWAPVSEQLRRILWHDSLPPLSPSL